MSNEMITSLLFTFHIILLGVKIWALWVVSTMLPIAKAPKKSKYMIVFNSMSALLFPICLAMVIAEAWFMYCFFMDVDLYYYEYLAMFDEIFFTILGINYFTKEGTNNG